MFNVKNEIVSRMYGGHKTGIRTWFILSILFLCSKSPVFGEHVIVALWDQNIEGTYDQVYEVKDFILPAFQKMNGEWSAVEGDVPSQTWTVAFNGKSLGTCQSRKMDHSIFLDAFQNMHESVSKVPHPDHPAKEISPDKHRYRSLVLVSQPYFKDPDEWKRGTLSADELHVLRKAFRTKYPTASNCEAYQKDSASHPVTYDDADIKVKTVYHSQSGAFLAEVALEKWGCDPIWDEPFEYQWFGISPDGTAHFISTRLTLIDAGDYDNDGKSELVFEDDSEGGDDDNSRGYSIWDANFKRLAGRVRFLH